MVVVMTRENKKKAGREADEFNEIKNKNEIVQLCGVINFPFLHSRHLRV